MIADRARALAANCGRGRGNIRPYLGMWAFGRSMNGGRRVDQHLCRVELLETFVPGKGYRLESCNINESFWKLDNGAIVFLHANGQPMTRFGRVAPNHWDGPYLLDERARVRHYLRR